MYGIDRLKIGSVDKNNALKLGETKKEKMLVLEASTKKTQEQIQQIGGIMRYDSFKSGYYVQQPNKKFVFLNKPDKKQLTQFNKFISVEVDLNFSLCTEEQKQKYKEQGYSGIIYPKEEQEN